MVIIHYKKEVWHKGYNSGMRVDRSMQSWYHRDIQITYKELHNYKRLQ